MLTLYYIIDQYVCSITLCSMFWVIIKIVVTKKKLLQYLPYLVFLICISGGIHIYSDVKSLNTGTFRPIYFMMTNCIIHIVANVLWNSIWLDILVFIYLSLHHRMILKCQWSYLCICMQKCYRKSPMLRPFSYIWCKYRECYVKLKGTLVIPHHVF